MKKVRLVTLALALLFALTACSSSGGGSSSQAPASTGGESTQASGGEGESSGAAGEGVSHADMGYPEIDPEIAALEPLELEVWIAADQAARPMFPEVKKLFEESYPNITININGSVPWEEMPAKVKLAVNSGAAPDLATHHPFVAGAQGFAEPLDDLWEKWGATDEFLESTIDDVTWDGVKYGVPMNVTSICLLYNEEMYNEAGIEAPPTTLDELVEVSKKLTVIEENRYGFACYANPWGIFGVIAAQGYDLMKDGKPTLTDPGVVETLTTYIEMATVDKVSSVPPPQESQAEVASALFGTGRAAQFITGTWDFSTLRDQYPDVWEKTKVAPLPGTSGSVAGGGGCFVPMGAKNREASFEFMKWLTADPFAIEYAKDFGQFPPKKGQTEDEFFHSEFTAPFTEALPDARPYLFEAFPESADAFEQAIRGGFDGGDLVALLESAQQIAETEIGSS